MARKHRTHRKGSKGFNFGGVNLMEIAVMGAGAGFAGLIGSQVSKLTGGSLNGNIAQGAAGVAMVMFGGKIHPMVRTAGKGVLIKTIGDLVEDNVVPKLSGMISGQQTAQGTASNTAWAN